jgi:hypothetical protein
MPCFDMLLRKLDKDSNLLFHKYYFPIFNSLTRSMFSTKHIFLQVIMFKIKLVLFIIYLVRIIFLCHL